MNSELELLDEVESLKAHLSALQQKYDIEHEDFILLKKENIKIKLDYNSLVQKTNELEEEIENLKIQLEQANCGIVQCGGCELVRLNTVKEFAEKLKDNIVNKYDTDKFLNSYDYFLSMSTVDDILKEYGVEL